MVDNAITDGLFTGVSEAINETLGISADYQTVTAALELAKRRGAAIDGDRLVSGVYEQLSGNWAKATTHLKKPPSIKNFRWFEPQLQISEENVSPEVTLERALINACDRAGRRDWSNQVPLISGVSGPHAYKRCAVDLVHQIPGGFEFVELKVGSDTPLSATMQVLQLGILWLLSRNDRHRMGYDSSPILDASILRLSVLAPAAFYDRFKDDGLSKAVNSGLETLGTQYGVTMSFSRTAFTPSFRWLAKMSDHELIDALDRRQTF